MDLMNRLNSSYKYVCSHSASVSINYGQIDKIINQLNGSSVTYWLDSNPFGLMDMEVESIINFLLIYHTIGDYCFWGDPKWEIETDLGHLDGSYAIMYLILNRFKKNSDFSLSFDEFRELLQGNVEIPLLEDRYQNLVAMNRFLKDNKKSFYELIKGLHTDSELLEYIVTNLDYFRDESIYDGKTILFYKRAQLLTSDILHVREKKEQVSVDYSRLVGCADYKIPQVMRCYGMLEFSKSLAEKVDSYVELEPDSKEEIEIRANALKVIDYIYEKLAKKYTRIDINDYIWLLGQDKSKMTKPYHRTLTNKY